MRSARLGPAMPRVMLGVGAVVLAAGLIGAAGPRAAVAPDGVTLRAGIAVPTALADALPAIGEMERGNRHFRAGRFREAVEAYRAALADGEDSAVLRYNLGTALLELGEYAEAEEHLLAALDVVRPETREWVYYNLGHRYLQDARGQGDPQATSALYDAAVESYRQALRLRPDDEDAKWNYELALRERDEQQQSSGGGGGEQGEGEPEEEQEGDQGGEGESPGRPSQNPDQGAQPGASPGQAPMTEEQAERILSAVEQDERELFQDKLRKGRQESPTARDW